MTTAKHTPGPWEANTFMVKAGRDVITQTGYSSSLAGNPGRSGEAQANARLIAAAPEMLALLRKAASDEYGSPVPYPLREAAKFLVAKAEGRS